MPCLFLKLSYLKAQIWKINTQNLSVLVLQSDGLERSKFDIARDGESHDWVTQQNGLTKGHMCVPKMNSANLHARLMGQSHHTTVLIEK